MDAPNQSLPAPGPIGPIPPSSPPPEIPNPVVPANPPAPAGAKALKRLQSWAPFTEYGAKYFDRSKWYKVRAALICECAQNTKYKIKPEDIVALGTDGVKGQTKDSVWSVTLEKRHFGKKGEPEQVDQEIVEVEDLVCLAPGGEELYLVLDIQGWPDKPEPK